MPEPFKTEAASLRCGDCHEVLHPAEQALPVAVAEDYYCPLCAKPVAAPLECDCCGSAICPRCGAPVEMADELGIG